MEMSSSSPPVQTVARALAVLDALADLQDGGVVEIARRVGLHPSTAHRLLAALIEGGYATQDRTTGRYRVGAKALELAGRAPDAAQPTSGEAPPTVVPAGPRAVGVDALSRAEGELEVASEPPARTATTSQRTFESILERLEGAIAQGALSAGDRLPSERELAGSLSVSRTSVREALRVLEALGVIQTRRGSEHGAVLVTEPGNAFVTIVRILTALRHIDLEEIVDFRAALESEAARRLAENPNAEALSALERILRAMTRDDIGQDEFHALDAEFHLTLFRAAGNRLVNLLAAGLSSTLRRVITEVGFLEARWTDVRPRIDKEHRALFASIRRGDGEKAANLASQHVRYWGDRVITHAEQTARIAEGRRPDQRRNIG